MWNFSGEQIYFYTNAISVTSFTNTAVWGLKVRRESVFLILADVFTRTVWQLIGIYGILL